MLERFKDIFSGLNTAYGKTKLTGKLRERDGKHETDNFIVRQEPTSELYQRHLDGVEPALGIIPINENSECRWGCVDIDVYNLDHKEIIRKIKDFPCVLFRSKSGGGHLFVFAKEWVPADVLRRKLKMISAYIGHAKAEIIPKQDRKRSDKSVGSYLNLPYHGGDRSARYAFDDEGNALNLEQFFKFYDKKAITLNELQEFSINITQEVDDDFEGIPPCLKTLLSNKVSEGGRNDTLFHLGVYLKKRFDKNWKAKMLMYNQKYFNPPLEDNEVITVSASVESENYLYKCKVEPMHSHCDPKACALVKFGVGDDTPSVLPESIEKYESDPPIYTVTIAGEEVDCYDEQLWNPDRFGVECMNQAGIILDVVAKPIWRKHLKKLFDDLQTTPAPESARLDFQLQQALDSFVSRAPGKSISDVKKSKSFTEEGKLTFRWDDFWRALVRSKSWPERTKTKVITQKMFCQQFNAKETTIKIDSKGTRVMQMDAIEVHKPIIRKNKKKKAAFEA